MHYSFWLSSILKLIDLRNRDCYQFCLTKRKLRVKTEATVTKFSGKCIIHYGFIMALLILKLIDLRKRNFYQFCCIKRKVEDKDLEESARVRNSNILTILTTKQQVALMFGDFQTRIWFEMSLLYHWCTGVPFLILLGLGGCPP